MGWINALIGLSLLVLSVLQFDDPEPLRWALVYFLGAVLAIITWLPGLSRAMSLFMAVATTGMLFSYFGAFFSQVPQLDANWYLIGQGNDALGLLFCGFAMIPVLAAYSCRMKADRAKQEPSARARAIVSGARSL